MCSEAIFDVATRSKHVKKLNEKRLQPDYWNDVESAQENERAIAAENEWLNAYQTVSEYADDLSVLVELHEEEAEDLSEEIEAAYKVLHQSIESLELRSMLSEKDDQRNAILTINPGAGGTESQDWAQMLLRMYTRYAERQGFDIELLERQPGDVAGIKSASLSIQGECAYGYLKSESGVHRLVRISPFDSNSRRHTSFASVFVYPEIDNTIEINLRSADIELQTFRSSGKGGQSVNKLDTGVRLIWTGALSNGEQVRVTAECTEERSQLQNRERAMIMLKSRVYRMEQEIQAAEKNKREAKKKRIDFGSQIRSYVFQPYTMVNDHRTELKVTDVQSVMDGDLQEFIKTFLLQ